MLLLIVLLLLTNPAMLISLSMLQQGSIQRKVANSSKQQEQQEEVEGQASRGRLLDALLSAEQLSQPLVVTHRGIPPLNPNPSNLPGSSAEERSGSSSSRPKPKVGSEEQLRHKRQHAFELGLEKMLFEVEKGWEADLKKDGKKKRVVNKPPGWQKIWYKRLGWGTYNIHIVLKSCAIDNKIYWQM